MEGGVGDLPQPRQLVLLHSAPSVQVARRELPILVGLATC